MNEQRTHEYINDFLYFSFRPDRSRGTGAYIYCSGVEINRFTPITKGRHRPMSNPVLRALQLVNLDVRAMALSGGATPKAIREDLCRGIVPPSDGWYKEWLLIENMPDPLAERIIGHCVIHLLKKTFKAMGMTEVALPDRLLPPDELQEFIEGLCRTFGPGTNK